MYIYIYIHMLVYVYIYIFIFFGSGIKEFKDNTRAHLRQWPMAESQDCPLQSPGTGLGSPNRDRV